MVQNTRTGDSVMKTIMLLGSRSRTDIGRCSTDSIGEESLSTQFIVGDCYGADALWQQALSHCGRKHHVYHIGYQPRTITNYGSPVRAPGYKQTDKDNAMFEAVLDDVDSEVWVAWDGKSAGTKRIIDKATAECKTIRYF